MAEHNAWEPAGDESIVESVVCNPQQIGSHDQLFHPSIAYGALGHAIAWEQLQCSPSTFTEIHMMGFSGNYVAVTEKTVTADANDREPDSVYAGSTIAMDDYYAIGYHGLVGDQTYVLFYWQANPHLTAVSNLTQDAHSVALAPVDYLHFLVAYNDGAVKVDQREIDSNSVDVVGTAVGETVTADNRPDIAIRSQ